MKSDHYREFNEEVSRYGKTLLFYAGNVTGTHSKSSPEGFLITLSQ
jgi:hypothetical protein